MIAQSLKMAWKSITLHKMRSFLTMLGIIIGVFALVVLVSLVHGATGSITDSVNSLGTNKLTVNIFDDKGKPLRTADLDEIAALDSVGETAPYMTMQVQASSAGRSKTVDVIGTTPSLTAIDNIKLQYGRFFKDPDIENHSNVAVIDYRLARDVMGRQDCVGESIKLNGKEFLIIGVLQDTQSDSAFGFAAGVYSAYVPFPTVVRLSDQAGTTVSTFEASANSRQLSADGCIRIHGLRKNTDLEPVFQRFSEYFFKSYIKILEKADSAYCIDHADSLFCHAVYSVLHIGE